MSFVPIASQTLTATTSTVTFSNIPAGFRDLFLVCKPVSSSGEIRFRFNNDSGSNYDSVRLVGNGSNVSSSFFPTESSGRISSIVQSGIFRSEIVDYSQTNKHKTVLSRADIRGTGSEMMTANWSNTSAVTEIALFYGSGNFASGDRFELYGIGA